MYLCIVLEICLIYFLAVFVRGYSTDFRLIYSIACIGIAFDRSQVDLSIYWVCLQCSRKKKSLQPV